MLAGEYLGLIDVAGAPAATKVPPGHLGDARRLIGACPPDAFAKDLPGNVILSAEDGGRVELSWYRTFPVNVPGQRIVAFASLGGGRFAPALRGDGAPELHLWPGFRTDQPAGVGLPPSVGNFSLDRPEDVASLADVFRWYRSASADA